MTSVSSGRASCCGEKDHELGSMGRMVPRRGDPLGQAVGPPSGFLSPHCPPPPPSIRALFIIKKNPHQIHWMDNPESREALLSPILTGAARALPARQRRKKIQTLIFQQTLNKREEKEG